ncbi:MAG: hypothetical protein IJ801_09865 [Lachnospiraceae bacterium]|nr:hypothetical protein [Lachnospiraceae bacterium]
MLDSLFSPALSLLQNAQMYGKYYADFEGAVFSDYCTQFGLNPTQQLRRLSKGEQLKFRLTYYQPVMERAIRYENNN